MESRIGVAWSENGVDWEDYTKNPVISPTEDYEILGCEYPKIYKYSDIYYMYYNAIWDKTFKKIKGSLITKDNDDLIGVDICLAISKDLLHWEKKRRCSSKVLFQKIGRKRLSFRDLLSVRQLRLTESF